MKNLLQLIVILTFGVLLYSTGYAFPGELDHSFGNGGKVTVRFGGLTDSFMDVELLPSGKIMAVGRDGSYHIVLARFNADGSADHSFGNAGFEIHSVGNSAVASELEVQPDGKLLVAGKMRMSGTDDAIMMVRFNPDGSFDPSFSGFGFNPSGGVDTVTSFHLLPDGKILLSGSINASERPKCDVYVIRLKANGSPDESFGAGGIVTTGIRSNKDAGMAINVLPDGKLLAIAQTQGTIAPTTSGLALIRYNSDGSLDASFGEGGVKEHYYGSNFHGAPANGIVTRDGKILVTMNRTFPFTSDLHRYLPDGSIDPSFGVLGKFEIGPESTTGYVLEELSDDKILIAGRGYSNPVTGLDAFIMRLLPKGTLDTSFGNNGVTTTSVGPSTSTEYPYRAAIQPDGKIVLAGDYNANGLFDYDAMLLRYHGDGLATSRKTLFDYDGDGKADISTFRPSTGIWHILKSQSGYSPMTWGLATDKLTPADYDGDGKTDIAVFRASESKWYFYNSRDGSFTTDIWGVEGDLPVPADYDGDGKADVAVYRPSDGKWYIKTSGNNSMLVSHWGVEGDRPVIGDYDADGKADFAVFRPSNGTWYLMRSTAGFTAMTWGFATDKPVPADYDGDGKTDIAVYRPSTGAWHIVNSGIGQFIQTVWGETGDIPVAADYDGDGKSDVAVYRSSNATWYIIQSTSAPSFIHFGEASDLPTPASFTY